MKDDLFTNMITHQTRKTLYHNTQRTEYLKSLHDQPVHNQLYNSWVKRSFLICWPGLTLSHPINKQ